MFIFVDQDRDQSPIVDEKETLPIGDVVSPREIQWQTRRFSARSQPNLHFHSVRLRKRNKVEFLTITGTSFHWSEDSEKKSSNMPNFFADQLVTSEETRSSFLAPSFPCSMNLPSRSEQHWAPLSRISFDHHFEREEEINTFLPTASVHLILHRGHKEQRSSDPSNLKSEEFFRINSPWFSEE